MPIVRVKSNDLLARVRASLDDEAKRAAGSNVSISRTEERAMKDGLLKDAVGRLRANVPGARVDAKTVATKATDAVARLLDEVNTRGKGTVSKAEVLALVRKDPEAGAHVAHAYELITGKRIDVPKERGLASQIPAGWRAALRDELEKPYFKELERFLSDERNRANVLPPPDCVFAALERTPLPKVKVVLLGQDPYPTDGNANGLSFSVPAGRPIPASLKNMFKVLEKDVGAKMPNHGGLEAWADQGVLLLNTVLTVRESEPNSHREHGWERFTRAIMDKVNAKQDRVVFLLLGKQAQDVAADVDTNRHAVVAAPHPSPMNPGNPFGKTRPFSAVNNALRAAGRPEVDWKIADV